MSSNIYSIDSIDPQGGSLKSHILAKTIYFLILANIIACSLYQLSSSSPASITQHIYSELPVGYQEDISYNLVFLSVSHTLHSRIFFSSHHSYRTET